MKVRDLSCRLEDRVEKQPNTFCSVSTTPVTLRLWAVLPLSLNANGQLPTGREVSKYSQKYETLLLLLLLSSGQSIFLRPADSRSHVSQHGCCHVLRERVVRARRVETREARSLPFKYGRVQDDFSLGTYPEPRQVADSKNTQLTCCTTASSSFGVELLLRTCISMYYTYDPFPWESPFVDIRGQVR